MKNARKIFVTIVLSTFLVCGLSGCSSNKSSDGYYHNIKWGISIEDLQNQLENDITASDDKNSVLEVVNNFEKINGVQAWIMYFFDNNKLSEITITPTIDTKKTDFTNDELNKYLYDNFIDLYGDPDDSSSIEYVWNTKYSNITLTMNNHIKYEQSK